MSGTVQSNRLFVRAPMARDEEWNYAVFTPEKTHRTGPNQAECLACHKPLDKTSYTFTIKELATVAKR